MKIFALGEDFDVDAYASKSAMVAGKVWHRGEPKGRWHGSLHTNSGIEYMIGDGNVLPYIEQQSLAIDFIKGHRDELAALGRFPGVTHFTLGLQYSKPVQRNLVGFALCVSPSLMWHLLDIGCQVTQYVWLHYPDTAET